MAQAKGAAERSGAPLVCIGPGLMIPATEEKGNGMRLSPVFVGVVLAAGALSACSENAQQQTQNAGNAIVADLTNAADDAEAAANRIGERTEHALNSAGRDVDNATDATGRVLENAGRDLRN